MPRAECICKHHLLAGTELPTSSSRHLPTTPVEGRQQVFLFREFCWKKPTLKATLTGETGGFVQLHRLLLSPSPFVWTPHTLTSLSPLCLVSPPAHPHHFAGAVPDMEPAQDLVECKVLSHALSSFQGSHGTASLGQALPPWHGDCCSRKQEQIQPERAARLEYWPRRTTCSFHPTESCHVQGEFKVTANPALCFANCELPSVISNAIISSVPQSTVGCWYLFLPCRKAAGFIHGQWLAFPMPPTQGTEQDLGSGSH